MLPMAMDVEALMALVIETISSGALVIIETTVRPTMKSDIPMRFARAAAPSVM